MTRRKKASSIALICLLIFAVMTFAGCSPGKKLPPGAKKIEFWTISLRPTYDDYIFGLISEYRKTHPDVYVESIDMPESVMMQKLMASIAGGVSPDLVNLNPATAQLLQITRLLYAWIHRFPPQ